MIGSLEAKSGSCRKAQHDQNLYFVVSDSLCVNNSTKFPISVFVLCELYKVNAESQFS